MLLKCKLPGLTGHPPHLKEQGAAIRYLKRQRALSAAERKKPGQEVQRKSLVTGVRIFFSEDATNYLEFLDGTFSGCSFYLSLKGGCFNISGPWAPYAS